MGLVLRNLLRRQAVNGALGSVSSATFDIEYLIDRVVEGVGAYKEGLGISGWSGAGLNFDIVYDIGGGASEGNICTGIVLTGGETTVEDIQNAIDAGVMTAGWTITCTSCDNGSDEFIIDVHAPLASGVTFNGYDALPSPGAATTAATMGGGIDEILADATIEVKNGVTTVETLFSGIFIKDTNDDGFIDIADIPGITTQLQADILAGRTVVVNSVDLGPNFIANVTVTWPASIGNTYDGYTIETSGSVIIINPVGEIGV